MEPLTLEMVHGHQFPCQRRVPTAGRRWLLSPLLALLGFRMNRYRRGGSVLRIISVPRAGYPLPLPSQPPPWTAPVQPQERQDTGTVSLDRGAPLPAGIGTLREPRMQATPVDLPPWTVQLCARASQRLAGRLLSRELATGRTWRKMARSQSEKHSQADREQPTEASWWPRMLPVAASPEALGSGQSVWVQILFPTS